MQAGGKILHKGVVYTDVGQCAANGARCGTDGYAKDRVEKQHADEQAPEAARDRARCRGVDEVVELDLSRLRLGGDHSVAKLDQIFLLQLKEPLPDFLGLGFRGVNDDDEI